AEGTSNLQDQINKKSQIFLGERQEFKKHFTKLYNYRSRFIHGEINFIHKYFTEDATDNLESYYDEFMEYKDFAVSMLLATLQKLIQENRHEIAFEYIMKQ